MTFKCPECKHTLKYVKEVEQDDDTASEENYRCERCFIKWLIVPVEREHNTELTITVTRCLQDSLENQLAPHGRCQKCNTPLSMEIYGSDADGNRGQPRYYCTNEKCEEGE